MAIDKKLVWNGRSPSGERTGDNMEVVSVDKARGVAEIKFDRLYKSKKVLPLSYVPQEHYDKITPGRRFYVTGNLMTREISNLVFTDFRQIID